MNRYIFIPEKLDNILKVEELTLSRVILDNIIFEKYETGCIFCESEENLLNYKGKKICINCYHILINRRE